MPRRVFFATGNLGIYEVQRIQIVGEGEVPGNVGATCVGYEG
ncbi:hypothetical protein IAD21_01262 [Abditibacteriota bacterium]|nr:hypothetical protein IAD21_01262 [Abditibacteriota bacterium]